MALDKGDATQVEQKLKEHGGGYPKKDMITVTYQVVNPQAVGGEGKGGASQQRHTPIFLRREIPCYKLLGKFSLRRDRPIPGDTSKS